MSMLNLKHMGNRYNPWVKIWIHPRVTMRWILSTNQTRYVRLLGMLAGIAYSGQDPTWWEQDAFFSIQFLGEVVLLGSMTGLVVLYVFGQVLTWTGNWLGGTGQPPALRAAVAWAALPRVAVIFLMFIYLGTTRYLDTNTQENPLEILNLIRDGLVIWSLMITVPAIAESHGFSIWKALGAFIVAAVIVLVPAMAIYFVITGVAF